MDDDRTEFGRVDRRRAEATPRLPPAVARVTSRGFEALARLRGARALHPRGASLAGSAVVDPTSGLATAETPGVVVRLSRGIGLPHPLPDFNGVAVRFVDAHGSGGHQDLLLTSAFQAPILRHLLRPARRFDRSGGTTVLPYRDRAGRRTMFRVDPPPLARLDDAPDAVPLRLVISQASLLGPWRPVAELRLTHVVPDDEVRFDPWHTSDALTPAGWLNALRGSAYAGSRRGTSGR